MSGATPACRIKINAAGDWQVVPPAGQIVQIGNAGATVHGLVNNDDLFVTGKFEVTGKAYFDDDVAFYDPVLFGDVLNVLGLITNTQDYQAGGTAGAWLKHTKITEEVTIPVGQGMAGINSAGNLAPANAIITSVAVRVTQAPGGGATNLDVGRTGGNTDEFTQNLAVALGTTGTSAANGDGVNAGPVHNAAANTFALTTDANVTGTDMKVRIQVFYSDIKAPTA